MNTMMLAAVSGSALIWLVITVIVAGLIYWIVDWGLNKLAIPEPFNKVARVILIIAVVVFLVNALLSVAGHGFIRMP